MKTRKLIALVIAAMLVLALFAGCDNSTQSTSSAPPANTPGTSSSSQPPSNSQSPPSQPSVDPNAVAVSKWVVPVLSSITGPIAYVGEPAIWAAQYAADKINAEGGVRGVPIEIIPYDTEFKAEVGAQYAAMLVDDSLFILGCMAAPVSLAMGQIIFDAKVPNIGSYAYQGIRDDLGPYVSAYMPDSDAGDLSAASQWTKKLGYKSIVVFYTSSDSAMNSCKVTLENELEKNTGTKISGYVEVETGALDVGSAVVQALSYGADAYYIILRIDEAGKVVNELRSRGVDASEKICVTFAGVGPGLIDICGDNANGLYAWQKLDFDYPGKDWQDLIVAYKSKFDVAPNQPPVPGFYNSILAFAKCVEELQLTGDKKKLQEERDAIANWMYNNPGIEGIQGTFSWTKGQLVTPAYMYQIKNGAFVSINLS